MLSTAINMTRIASIAAIALLLVSAFAGRPGNILGQADLQLLGREELRLERGHQVADLHVIVVLADGRNDGLPHGVVGKCHEARPFLFWRSDRLCATSLSRARVGATAQQT